MSMNETPSANRLHIGFFGRRNVGKSSLLNKITNQDLAVVSSTPGTTTDPVFKTMELLPLGPVVLIDTPGIDDEGALGEKRIEKTIDVLNKVDIAVLVADFTRGKSPFEEKLLSLFEEREIPYIIALNKVDDGRELPLPEHEIAVSAKADYHITELKEKIASMRPKIEEKPLLSDLISPKSFVVMVTPIDESAPKGRIILPQQQALRDILDGGATAIVVKETEYKETLESLGKKPALVVTDSQVFGKVSAETPSDIPLTSFSILMARKKGFLTTAVVGASVIDTLQDGDKVLISEGCTHHRQCGDIGSVKLPMWLEKYTGKSLSYEFSSGTGFPKDLSPYRLVIHCGGCMLTEREVRFRMNTAKKMGIPFTNYGTAIAKMNGILERSLSVKGLLED